MMTPFLLVSHQCQKDEISKNTLARYTSTTSCRQKVILDTPAQRHVGKRSS